MSISSAIDANNPDLIYRGKFYPDLIPFGHPHAQQNLGQVLAIGNQALSPTTGLPQDATDFDTLGCVKIETGTVGMGNQPALVIGEPGDILQIKGATALGSILVGNGLNTEELVAGANGLVLTTNSSAPLGLEWAVGGGGGGVASVSAGNNITVSGTATNPIVAVASPLNATLNVATQNITATTGIASFTGASSVANISENGVSTYDAITATTLSTLAKTGLTTATLTDSMSATPTGLSKTLGATALTLSSSTAPIQLTPNAGTNCAVSISGTGNFQVNQSSTGGATQPATSVINTNGGNNAVHLDLYKNSSSPANDDGIAGVSYHANNSIGTKVEYARIQADQRDVTSGSENGSVSVLVAQNSPTPTEYMRFNGVLGTNDSYKNLDMRGNQITTTSGGLNILQQVANQNVGLTNTAVNGSILLNKTNTGGSIGLSSSTSVSITASTAVSLVGSSSGIITNQNAGSRSTLRTGLGSIVSDYVDYLPSVVVENANSNSAVVPVPKTHFQSLTLINGGVSPLTSWTDATATNWSGASVFQYHPYSNTYWIAYNYGSTSSVIYITTDLINLAQTISLSNSSSGGGPTRCLCLYPSSSYMYIGGDFSTINGNATPQAGITRVNTSGGLYNFIEDPIYSSINSIFGVIGYVNTICEYAGEIYFGGSFGSTFGTLNTLYNLCKIDSLGAGSGNQNYTNNSDSLAVDNVVYCSAVYGSYIFWGGEYYNSYWNGSGWNFNTIRFAYYDVGTNNWGTCDNNLFNAPVYSCCNSAHGSYIFCAGTFTQNGYNQVCYIDANSPNSSQNAGFSLSGGLSYLNCVANQGGQDTIIDNNTNVWRSPGFLTWEDLSVSNPGGYYPGGIYNFGGSATTIYTAYSNYGFIRVLLANSQVVNFVAPTPVFRYAGATYTTATLNTRYSTQAFIADGTSTYYYPVGVPNCIFS